ncbi:7751_t:CDS:1, partial [Dentiscutata heterogama]
DCLPLTNNEKWMIVNVHKYFSDATSIDKQHQKLSLCKYVALVLGILKNIVGSVVANWNKHNDSSFLLHKNLG